MREIERRKGPLLFPFAGERGVHDARIHSGRRNLIQARDCFGAAHRSRGFTLVECLAALLIFALSFSVLLDLNSTALKQSRRADENTKAALHAASLMDSFGVGEPLKEGGDSGKFDDGYSWNAEFKEFQVPPDPNSEVQTERPETGMKLYQIDLTIRWGRGQSERQSKFSTLRAVRPENIGG